MISPQGDKIQGTTPLPLAAAITNDFPGIKSAKIQHVAFAVKIEDQKFRESISFVDHGFLDLFEVQTQDEKQARFDNNNDVYISQALATKYFGKRQAIGQIIQVPLAKDNSLQLVVAGILADLPENTSFHMNLLVPFAQYLNIYDLAENDWLNWVDGTFLFSEQLNTESISEAMMKYIEVQNTVNKGQEVSNYQIDSILKWPAFENTLEKSSFVSLLHPASVLGTLSSAIAVLLLASFNFINTSIAISRRRLKEIGMRKVLGGRKRDLKIQFLIESLVQMFIAIGFSGIITYFLSQAYNAMFSFEIVEFSRIKLLPFLGFMLLIWLATGLLAGMYPAFYISKFESIEIFRNKVRFTRKNVFMKVLLTFQLMVCIYNVFSLIVFIQNAQYQEKLDRGYTVDDSINIPLSNSEQFESLKSSLDGMPLVKRVTGTVDPIGFSSKNIAIDYQGTQKDVASITVGQGYLESLRVRLNTGNFFGVNEEVNKTQIMINSMLADKLPGDY